MERALFVLSPCKVSSLFLARAIDLSWNLVMGRGLQGGLAPLTYRVANAALLCIAETIPLSYRTFEAITISQLNLSALWPLSKAVYYTGGWRAKTPRAVLLITAFAIVLLSTASDVITGYVQNTSPYWQFSNRTMGLVTSLDICLNPQQIEVPCLGKEILPVICVPQVGYTWGFTGVLLLAFVVALGLLGFALYGIWVDADRNSVLYRSGRKLGTWRAITDLAIALEKETGADMTILSD